MVDRSRWERSPICRQTAGREDKRATLGLPKGADHKPRTEIAYLHTVIDDHSRVAYVEICSEEKSQIAVGVAVVPRRVRRTWSHRRAGPVRQRVGIPIPGMSRCLGSNSASSRKEPAPVGLRRAGRSIGSTALSATVGPTHASTPRKCRTPSCSTRSTGRLHSYTHHRAHSALARPATGHRTDQRARTSHLGRDGGDADEHRAAVLANSIDGHTGAALAVLLQERGDHCGDRQGVPRPHLHDEAATEST